MLVAKKKGPNTTKSANKSPGIENKSMTDASIHSLSEESTPTTDMDGRTCFPRDLNASSPLLNLEQENPNDVLAIAHNATVDNFRMNKKIFHEIKDIDLKLHLVSNKQDGNSEGLWNEDERKTIVDSTKDREKRGSSEK